MEELKQSLYKQLMNELEDIEGLRKDTLSERLIKEATGKVKKRPTSLKEFLEGEKVI